MNFKRKRENGNMMERDVVKKRKSIHNKNTGVLETMAVPTPKNNIEYREVKSGHKELYNNDAGVLTTSAIPVPKSPSNGFNMADLFGQMFGINMPKEEGITKKELLFEKYGTNEIESPNLWNEAVKEYKDAYEEVKKIDLKPIRNLLHKASTNPYLLKTKDGKILQKETVENINKFAESRYNVLKNSPVPEKIDENTDLEGITPSLLGLVLNSEAITTELADEVDRVIQNAEPVKVNMFDGAKKEKKEVGKNIGINKNNLEFTENEIINRPSVQFSKSAGVLFSVASDTLEDQITELANNSKMDPSTIDVEMPDVRKDIYEHFDTSSKNSPHIIQDLVNNYTSAYNDVLKIDTKELLSIRQSTIMDKDLTKSTNGKKLKTEILSKIDSISKNRNKVLDNVIHPKKMDKTNFTNKDISTLNKVNLDYVVVKELHKEAKIRSRNNAPTNDFGMYC